jgi:hypothetical protein
MTHLNPLRLGDRSRVSGEYMKMFDLYGRAMFPMLRLTNSEGGGSVEATPEEPVVPAEGEGTTPTDQGEDDPVVPENNAEEDWTTEFDKKGPEGITKEARRMREKIAKLEAEAKARTEVKPEGKIEPKAEPKTEVKAPQAEQKFDPIAFSSRTEAGRADMEVLRSTGMDDKQITSLLHIFGRLANDISGASIEPIASEFREGRFTRALDSFSKDDNFKFGMSKPEIKKDMEAYIRSTFDPKLWADKEVMKAAYGLALSNHPEIFAQGKREIIEGGKLNEKPDGSSVATSNSVEIQQFAKSNGMDYATKEDRQIAKDAYTAWKGATATK